MTLVQIVLLTRHGARSPIDSYYDDPNDSWECDDEGDHSYAPRYSVAGTSTSFRRTHLKYDSRLVSFPPSCPKGGLLTEGMFQHYKLGQFFRKIYVNVKGFLPKRYNPDEIYVRSSEVDRCIRSAQSFLYGLYPPAHPDDSITITTGTPALELLHPSTSQCKDLSAAWKNWTSSEDYLERKARATPYLKPLADAAGVKWDEATWMYIGDWMATIACTGHEFPDLVNDTVLQVGMEAVEFYSHGFFSSSRGVAASAILREIMRVIDDRLSGKTKVKFALLSAHDVSIVAVLIALGYNNPHWSPFRSYFATEVWKDQNEEYYLKFLYNSEEVAVDFMENQTLVKLSRFRGGIAKYLSYCKEMP